MTVRLAALCWEIRGDLLCASQRHHLAAPPVRPTTLLARRMSRASYCIAQLRQSTYCNRTSQLASMEMPGRSRLEINFS